jgi:hypothetical protein
MKFLPPIDNVRLGYIYRDKKFARSSMTKNKVSKKQEEKYFLVRILGH